MLKSKLFCCFHAFKIEFSGDGKFFFIQHRHIHLTAPAPHHLHLNTFINIQRYRSRISLKNLPYFTARRNILKQRGASLSLADSILTPNLITLAANKFGSGGSETPQARSSMMVNFLCIKE